jgi:hypothetical protein
MRLVAAMSRGGAETRLHDALVTVQTGRKRMTLNTKGRCPEIVRGGDMTQDDAWGLWTCLSGDLAQDLR